MLFEDARTRLSQLVNKILDKERMLQVEEIKGISDRWKPGVTDSDFRSDMAARVAYFHGSMKLDMKKELKRRFPQTHEELNTEQVNLKLLRKKIKDKAKVFLRRGKLRLIDENGNPANDGSDERFQDLLESSRFFSNCKQADEYTQLCHRSLFKPWWDAVEKRVQISIWPPHMIHVAPDPDRWWDINSAYAVLLELPGVDGPGRNKPRYEVWGYRDIEAAATTRKQTVHYTTDGERDYQLNPGDVNPFSDAGRPIYPFTLWKDDETTDLFRVEEDMLTMNRCVNSLLTDTQNAVKYMAWPVSVYTMAEGQKDGLGVKTVGPSAAIDIVHGATLQFLTPDLPLHEIREYFEALIRDDAISEGMGASTLRTEKAAPESGYHYKLQQKPLAEHRENNVEIYRPFVLESAKKTAIVWNTYNPSATIDLKKYRMVWEPGDMEIPENPEEIANNETMKIANNVSSVVEWRMRDTGEDRQTAQKSVKKNQKDNQKLSGGGSMPENADNRLKTGEKPPFEPEKPESQEGIDESTEEKTGKEGKQPGSSD